MASQQELTLKITGDSRSAETALLAVQKATVKQEQAVESAKRALEKYGAESTQYRAALIKAKESTLALDKAQGKLKGNTSSLKDGVGQLRSAYYAVIGVVAGVVAVVMSSIKVFAESEAVNKRLERAIQNTGASWEQNADAVNSVVMAQSRLAAVDDDLIKGSLATLVQMTGDLTEAQRLNTVALNMSRATGKDLNTTALLLGKVYTGNVSILKRYGIVVKDGATATEALGEIQKKYAGYAKDYGEGTQASLERLPIAYENAQESAGKFAIEVLELDEGLNYASARLEEMAAGEWSNVVRLQIPIYGAFYQKQLKMADAAEMASDALDEQKDSLRATQTAVVTAGIAYQRYTAAVDESNQAIAAEQDAELKALRTKEDVKDKREALTETIKEHGKKSREARIATLELEIAEREAAVAAKEFKNAQAEANSANKRLASEGGATIEYLKKLRDLMASAGGKAATLGRRVNAIQNRGTNAGGFTQNASGSIVTTPQLSWVGEAGYPESIISWDPRYRERSLAIMSETARAIGATGTRSSSSSMTVAPGAVQVNVSSTNATAAEIGAAVDEALTKVVRRAGRLQTA